MRTRVGYAGGTLPDATYRHIGDHTECVQIDFDPAIVRYETLLGEFLLVHDPSRPAHSSQYASLVLTVDEAQSEAARVALDAAGPRLGRPALTRVAPLQTFYVAEDYHQKYALRTDRLLGAEVRERYPDETAFRESTLAARLNGYVYGVGGATLLEREIESYGLSAAGEARLWSLAGGGS